MRLAQFRWGGKRILAAECGEYWLDLTGAYAWRLHDAGEEDPRPFAEALIPADMKQFIARASAPLAVETLRLVRSMLADGQEVCGIDGEPLLFQAHEVVWEAPIAHPGKLLCVGRNYLDHCRETGSQVPERPLFFSKPATAIAPHGYSLRLPNCSDEVDLEAELAVVIGRRGLNLSEEEALSVVAGYTIMNDITARDLQRTDGQWTRAKGLDGFAPLGPIVVTPDELTDPGRLRIRSWLNGDLMQDGNTADMIFGLTELLVAASKDMTLEPGDIIATGTPAGVGVARTPPVFLQAGDRVRIEIEGIGCLETHISQRQPSRL